MDTLGFKELRDFVEKSEILEISLQDITKQLQQNIQQIKLIQLWKELIRLKMNLFYLHPKIM